MSVTPSLKPAEFDAAPWLHSAGSWEHSVAVVSDGRIITTERGLSVWDPKSEKCVARWVGDGISEMANVAAAPVDATVAIHVRYSEQVWIVDVDTGAVLHALPTTQPSRGIAFSPDGRWLATGGGYEYRDIKDPVVRVWDVETGELVFTLKGLTKSVTALAWSSDGTRVVAGKGKAGRIWTLIEGGVPVKRPRAALKFPMVGPAGAFAFVPDSDDLLIAGGQTISRVEPTSREGRWEKRWDTIPTESCVALAVTPRGIVANVVDDLVLLDLDDGRELWRERGPRGLRALAVTRDGEHVLSLGLAKSVRVNVVATGARLNR